MTNPKAKPPPMRISTDLSCIVCNPEGQNALGVWGLGLHVGLGVGGWGLGVGGFGEVTN
jgi:hypothetical protein